MFNDDYSCEGKHRREGRPDERSSKCQVSSFPNPLLYKSEKIDVEGVTIDVLDSLNYDKIRISKKS